MAERSLQVVDQTTGVLSRADEWTKARVEFVRNAYCGGAPDAEASAFIEICKRRGLAPEERQVYLVKRGDRWSIQTGIDGYRLIADRTGAYAGSDEPLFAGESKDGYPDQATVTVHKMVSGQPRAFTGTAFWSEYYPGDGGQGQMWRKMPRTMLAKCAEALALRKAFPADLSGIYTSEEMDQAGPATTIAERPKAKPAKSAPVVADDMTDQEYANRVAEALTNKNGVAYKDLVAAAGDHKGRWMVLIDQADSIKAVDWVVKTAGDYPADADADLLQTITDFAEARKTELLGA